MDLLPSELLLEIFERFLPPPICNTSTTNHIPLEKQIELLKNLVVCKLVCRMWRDIIKGKGVLFSRDAYHATEDGPRSRDASEEKGGVKGLVIWKTRSCESTFSSVLSLFPNLTYLSWTCEISCGNYLRNVSYPPLKHLRRLDWRFSGDFDNSFKSFTNLVRCSPVLEYITVAEVPEAPLNGRRSEVFLIPDSVTTLGIFCHHPEVWHLLRWIKVSWGGGQGLKHVITSGTYPRLGFPTVELRPDPSSTTQPTKAAFEDFVRDCLPKNGSSGGTLIYSCTTYPPAERYDLVPEKSAVWVDKVVLRTLSSSHKTEVEEWEAVQRHLDFVLKKFPNLKNVDLDGDFQEWKEDPVKGEVLEAFGESAQERRIVVEYLKQNA